MNLEIFKQGKTLRKMVCKVDRFHLFLPNLNLLTEEDAEKGMK